MISRDQLLTILKNVVEDYNSGELIQNFESSVVVNIQSIVLMDSNDNCYLNENENDIRLEVLKDDDELQLVSKFVETDIDEAHNWVEQLMTRLELENKCEIIDEGDFNESSIISVFILEDFDIETKEDSKEIEENILENDLIDSDDNDNEYDLDLNKGIINEEENIDSENRTLNALDILNNIDPLTGQMNISKISKNEDLKEENIEEKNINVKKEDNNEEDIKINEEDIKIDEEKNINITEKDNSESTIDERAISSVDQRSTIDERAISSVDQRSTIDEVKVVNATDILNNKRINTKNRSQSVKSTTIAVDKIKINKDNSVIGAEKILNSLGISLIGKSNRVSAKTADGRTMSAAAQVKEMLDEITAKNSMTEEALTALQDVAICKSEMRLSYPLFMRVNPNLAYKDQASFGGKKRYGKKTITYLDKEFYVTNHIFVNNVARIRNYLESLGLIDKVENSTVESNVMNKQKAIQELINQKTGVTTTDIKVNIQ